MVLQRTFREKQEITGLGVHSGQKVTLAFHPAAIDTGIVFYRSDLANAVDIPALSKYVVDTRLGTTLAAANGQRVATVEHLMAALAALGIDNARIGVSGEEIPIMDGSSASFLLVLKDNIETQDQPKKFIRIKQRIAVEDEDKFAALEPYHGFRATLNIDFDHPAFDKDKQALTVDFSTQSFTEELSRARTFGFLKDQEMLLAMGLARGSSLDNTVVLDEHKVLNEEGLRYDDEFVRHKILDAIGDLYLLGHPIIGEFKGAKSGHTMNHLLREQLLAEEKAWETVTFKAGAKENAPLGYLDSSLENAVAV